MAYIREYPPRITVGPCGLVLSNSKVDKVTPLFFIKTIDKGCRVASQDLKCGALPIKLYLFARALFIFFFSRAALFQATMVFISYDGLITLVVHLHYI